MPKLLDLTGQRFGQLVALEQAKLGGRIAWLCRCDCGSQKVIRSSALTSGNSTSCKLPGRHTQKAVVDFPIYGPFISRQLAQQRGYKWYVIDAPCKKGHACERQTANARCRECGAEKNTANCRRWYNEKGRDQVIEQARAWAQSNPDRRRQVRSRHAKKALATPQGKIKRACRRRVVNALMAQSLKKTERTEELMGCSVEFMAQHIQKQFTDAMTWENYGRKTWHIDHIRPCESFDLEDPAQRAICFNWRNQRPLSAIENMIKKDAWTEAMECEWVEHMHALGWGGDLSLVYGSARLAA